MKEKDFQRRVTDMATRFGWKVWHVPAPMRHTKAGFVGAKEAAGLPDLIMLHDDPPRLIFAELKGTGGELSDEQRTFLSAARDVADRAYDIGTFELAPGYARSAKAVGVYVWAPGDEQTVEDTLRVRVMT